MHAHFSCFSKEEKARPELSERPPSFRDPIVTLLFYPELSCGCSLLGDRFEKQDIGSTYSRQGRSNHPEVGTAPQTHPASFPSPVPPTLRLSFFSASPGCPAPPILSYFFSRVCVCACMSSCARVCRAPRGCPIPWDWT